MEEPRYPRTAMAENDEIRIAVWQFVRIMVALEGRRPRAKVYDDWKLAWREVDNELIRLSKSDHAAYSELMMNQEVVLTLGNQIRRSEVTRALARVTRDIKRRISAPNSEVEERKNLKYELGELNALKTSLSRDTRSAR